MGVEDDRPVAGFDSGRLQAVLAYLLVQGRTPLPRHYVAAVLWPDSEESQARTNLRKYIHKLRGVLPAVDGLFDLGGRQIQWRPEATAVVDVHEFERCVARGKRLVVDKQSDGAAAAFEQAVALYQGVLLPACYDEWVARPRERLASEYIQALDQLAQLLEQRGNYSQAIMYVQRLLEQDILRESSYRRLIHLHALAGDRAKALAVYEQCVAVLHQELDVEPSGATRQLYERVKATVQTDLQQGSQYQHKTMIWIDVAGFSGMVERYVLQMVMDDFAVYTRVVVEQIGQEGGVIVKRMGDALLAMADQPENDWQVVRQVQGALQEFNEGQSENGRPIFHTRICLTTGEVLLTQMEIDGMREMDVMGRCVNLVARLQAVTPVDGITLDQLTYGECRSLIKGDVMETVFSDKYGSEAIYVL